jgi:pimeloyl-ACP methyl ester carboxylesterase
MRLLFSRLGPVLPGLMGSWAYRLWFRTRRFPESAAARGAMSRARHSTLQANGIPVAVYAWGQGPVVLFVHGWSGRGSQAAAFVEPLTGAGYRLVSVDAPGHGNTPGDRTTLFECAAVLQAVAAELGPVYAAVTHSFGGMVLAYALRHGMTVERVVMISPPADLDFLLDSFAQLLAMPAAVRTVLQRKLEQRFDDDLAQRISTMDNVGALSMPALILHDMDDASIPWQQGQRVAAAWTGARFVETRGLGHSRILRDPDALKAVVDFIKG